jgi:hypothetical protein
MIPKGPLIFLALAATLYWEWPREMRYPPGILVPAEPRQISVLPAQVAEVAGCKLMAMATYGIQARVLHTKRYWSGWGSDLVPYDVAVGWGPMSDQSVLDQLKISQSNRFFFYRWDNAPPLAPDIILSHAANMHLIAANADIGKSIAALHAGQLVAMAGYLVNVRGPGGFAWNTSLSRTDTGNGACEVFYVTGLSVGAPAAP